jgi:hypothetical protein
MPRHGPRTPEGLAVSSHNATRHGLYSEAVVVDGETLVDWQAFVDAIVESVAPGGALEAELAVRAASLLWRLRRVPAAEANLTARDAVREAARAERRARMKEEGVDLAGPAAYYASVLPAPDPVELPPIPIPDGPVLATIARYEAHLNRQLLHALHELEVLQARRKGQRTPLARVDVHGLPGTWK